MISKERIKTNHLLMDELNYWDELTLKDNSDSYTNMYYIGLLLLINRQLENGVQWLSSEEAKEYFLGEVEYQNEVFASLEEQWDEILNNHYDTVEELLSEVYRRGKEKGYADMGSRIRYSSSDKLALSFALNYNFGLIRKIDWDVRKEVKNRIMEGIIAGEHPYTIAPKLLEIGDERLSGTTLTPKQRAVMIARTEVSRVQNTGILQSYVNEGYTEVKILTAEDSSVCYLCLKNAYEFNDDEPIVYSENLKERVHNIFEMDSKLNLVPLHPNCRCTFLSVWGSKGTSPENPPVINLNVPIDDGTDYKEDTNYQIENNQRNLQHSIFGDDFEGKSSLINWALDDSDVINGKIYNDDYYKDMIKEGKYTDEFIDHMINDIDNCIEEAPPLQEDTILWMGREFDETLKPLEVSSYDGFCSSSFQERIADNHSGYGEKYKIKIKAPKGTKGFCVAYAEQEEHEFLLGRNQKFMVEEIDTVNKTATIRLIND